VHAAGLAAVAQQCLWFLVDNPKLFRVNVTLKYWKPTVTIMIVNGDVMTYTAH